MSIAPYPDWIRPPVGGYTADDLDRLPDLPPHTQLIDGSLVFASPQTTFHVRAVSAFDNGLLSAVPDEWEVWREMNVRLDKRNRPEPDVMVVAADAYTGPKQTCFDASDVLLVVEVVSEESQVRDREIKPRKYAAAGIRYFWRVESDDERPVVYAYELDPASRRYIPVGIFHNRLKLEQPFPIDMILRGPRPRPDRGHEVSAPGTPE